MHSALRGNPQVSCLSKIGSAVWSTLHHSRHYCEKLWILWGPTNTLGATILNFMLGHISSTAQTGSSTVWCITHQKFCNKSNKWTRRWQTHYNNCGQGLQLTPLTEIVHANWHAFAARLWIILQAASTCNSWKERTTTTVSKFWN